MSILESFVLYVKTWMFPEPMLQVFKLATLLWQLVNAKISRGHKTIQGAMHYVIQLAIHVCIACELTLNRYLSFQFQ